MVDYFASASWLYAICYRLTSSARRVSRMTAMQRRVLVIGAAVAAAGGGALTFEAVLSIDTASPFGHTRYGHAVGWLGQAVILPMFCLAYIPTDLLKVDLRPSSTRGTAKWSHKRRPVPPATRNIAARWLRSPTGQRSTRRVNVYSVRRAPIPATPVMISVREWPRVPRSGTSR